MELSFVNGEDLPCGCSAAFLSGEGQYSDVISVILCAQHSPQQSGEWVWADLFGESVAEHPKNPNVACFTKVWLPKEST